LCAVDGAAWIALQPPLESLIVPGATNVRVVATGWGEWQIAYRAPGPPYAWYYALAHGLEARHWTALDGWRPGGTGSVYHPIVPLRFQQVYFGFIQDQIVLIPDDRSPNSARITIRRWVVPRWGYRP
ncbi:MAG: hypothetical protein ACJ8CR_25885, partial [Roseiflexaceae bacterium]